MAEEGERRTRGGKGWEVNSLPESTASLICQVSSKFTRTRTSILRCIALFITTSIRGCRALGEERWLSPRCSRSLLSPSAPAVPSASREGVGRVSVWG